MKAKNIIKKLNKTYSIVIIPNTNESVMRITFQAPALKVLLMLLFGLFVIFTVLFVNSTNPKRNNNQEINTAQLQQQVKTLNSIIDQQNKSLSLSKNQLDLLKKTDAETKTHIAEFNKLYSDIASSFISKSSRGAVSSKNPTDILAKLKKLSAIVEELDGASQVNAELAAQLAASNQKLDEFIEYLPTFAPVPGGISSTFGVRKHPIKKVLKVHEGVDLDAAYGDSIYAAASGEVKFAGYSNGYGYNVIIDHKNGLKTIYGHASKLLVKQGQLVKKGHKIALVGSTGLSTSPHLHFEIRVEDTPVDPTQYINFAISK